MEESYNMLNTRAGESPPDSVIRSCSLGFLDNLYNLQVTENEKMLQRTRRLEKQVSEVPEDSPYRVLLDQNLEEIYEIERRIKKNLQQLKAEIDRRKADA